MNLKPLVASSKLVSLLKFDNVKRFVSRHDTYIYELMREYPTLHRQKQIKIKEQFYIYQSQYRVVHVSKLIGHNGEIFILNIIFLYPYLHGFKYEQPYTKCKHLPILYSINHKKSL
jgi:predicted metal-dependent hydrolase